MSSEVWRYVHCPRCGRDYVERCWEEMTHVSCPTKRCGNGVVDRTRVAPAQGKSKGADDEH
jgi:hypothetical protein